MYQILRKNKLISLHIMVIFLGFTGVLGKLITENEQLDTTHLVWHRMFIAFITLIFILTISRNKFKQLTRKDILPLLLE